MSGAESTWGRCEGPPASSFGKSARSVTETRLGMACQQAGLRLSSLPAHGILVVLSFLYFHCNIHSRACGAYTRSAQKRLYQDAPGAGGRVASSLAEHAVGLQLSPNEGGPEPGRRARTGPREGAPVIPLQAFLGVWGVGVRVSPSAAPLRGHERPR